MNTPLMPPEYSPALVLAYIQAHEPVRFIGDVGPFPFNVALSLLVFHLVVMHSNDGVTSVVVTGRGACIIEVGMDDADIVEVCRNLRRDDIQGMFPS